MLQIAIIFVSSVGFTVITLAFDTFKTASDRRMGLLHEFSVLFASYCFLIFNVVSVEINFKLGYITIGVVATYMALSLMVQLCSGAFLLKWKSRKQRVVRQYRKDHKRLQQALKENHPKTKKRLEKLREPIK